jgi:hypothetical protein
VSDKVPSVIKVGQSEPELQEFLAEIVKLVPLTLEQQVRLKRSLAELTEHPFNKADGQVSAMLGPYHFPLRKTLFAALVHAVTLTGGLIVMPVDSGITFTGSVLAAIQQASDLLKKLDASEVQVYEAIGEAMKRVGGEGPKVTSTDIENVFDERGAAVPKLDAVLASLQNKGAIQSEVVAQQVYYSVRV